MSFKLLGVSRWGGWKGGNYLEGTHEAYETHGTQVDKVVIDFSFVLFGTNYFYFSACCSFVFVAVYFNRLFLLIAMTATDAA